MLYFILGIITGIFLVSLMVVLEFYLVMKKKEFIVNLFEQKIKNKIGNKKFGKIFPGADDPDVKLNDYLDKKSNNNEDVYLDEIL